jgi:undecaprenyl-diphosphatase
LNFIEILKAFLFGVVEGVTEWLPISSTGHMIILDEFVTLDVSGEFWEMFLVVTQLGAIMAVVVMFWDRIFPFSFQKGESFVKKDKFKLWLKIIIATIPAVVIGIPLDDFMEEHLRTYIIVALALIVYGIWFLFLEGKNKNKSFAINSVDEITYKVALGIGLFQVLALIPGTSRSGSTIIGAMILGCSRRVAAEFTFYLAIPVMFGASLLKILKFGFVFTGQEIAILAVGTLTAFVVSVLSIRFLMNYVRNHDFKVFGIYRIVLGCILILYSLLR